MIIHQPTRSIVLKLRDPQRILDAFPGSSRVIDADEGNVQIRHTLKTAVALNAMGLHHVTSPILYRYDWPGRYKPFTHQIPMADFHVRNDKCLNLSEMGCVSGDTEYLSPTGWRRIDNYDGSQVAQYWPETDEIEFVRPDKYVKLPCEDMIQLKTTRGVDQLLSPEHRVLLADGSVVSAEHIAAHWGSQSTENRRFRFRTTFKVRGTSGVPLTDAQIRVQVATNADGSQRKSGRIDMRLKKRRKIERMRQLLDAARIAYTETDAMPVGFKRFSFYPPMTKGFSQVWWEATQAQLEIIAEELPHWDGSHRKAGGVSFFGIQRDAEFAQYVFSASGRRSIIKHDSREYTLGAQMRVNAKSGDPTVGLVQRNTRRGPNVWWTKAPDGMKYCFVVPSTFLLLRRNGCIFATGNTGKSFATLWAADYLMSIGEVRKALILSPLSILETVWQQDVFDVLMHRTCVVTHGDRDYRVHALGMDVDFYIVNHDMIRHKEVATAVRKRKDIDLIILDEASFFRNARNISYKFLAWAVEKKQRIWLLTGTPCPNAPTDAWALARLVCPSRVPPFFGTFQRRTMQQESQYRWRPLKGADQIVFAALQPAWRVKKKGCLSLPPLTVTNHEAKLTAEQEEAFQLMRRHMMLAHSTGVVTAVHAADALLKLRQICCGATKNAETDSYEVLDHSHRLRELLDVISQASAKVIVIVPFKGIIRALEPAVAKHYSVGVLNGDVSLKQRTRIINAFKSGPDPHVLLCHPRVMAHGLNLTEADVTVFYAPIYSHDEYAQVIERFNRVGQTRKMTVVRIAAHSFEWDIYRLLDARAINQDNILKLYETIIQ